jgi:hypothetical protein
VKVSIVTPCLNAEAHIGACLASVTGQTHPRSEIEHVVVDGMSKDRTAELARASGARVLVGRDRSLYEALNKGIAAASGDLLVWLNADDVLRPGAVERLVAAARAAPDADLLVGDCAFQDAEGTRIVRSPRDALSSMWEGRRRAAWVVPLVAVFRTGALRSLGPYDDSLRVCADLDLWFRAAAREPPLRVVSVDSVIGTFRIHPGSLSTGGRAERRNLEEAFEVAQRWHENPDVPRGVRDYARFVLRRTAYALQALETRGQGAFRRKAGTLRAWLRWRALGPGTLADFFTSYQ